MFVDKVKNLDKMRESNLQKDCKASENHTKRLNSMDFGFNIMIDFTLNIDKLNLANLVGEVMDKIMEFQNFLYLQKKIA